MTETTLERWGAASGWCVGTRLAASGDPAAVASHVVEYRSLILAQSALMLLSAALFAWFLATPHGYLRRIGKPTARRIPIRHEDELVVHH